MPVIDLSQDPDSGSVAGPSEDGNAAAGPSRRSAGRNPSNSLRAEPSSDNDVELVSASQPSRASSPPVRSYTRRSQRLRESRQSSQGGLHLPDVPNYSFVNLADTQEEPVALGNNIGSAPSGGTERSWLSRISDTIHRWQPGGLPSIDWQDETADASSNITVTDEPPIRAPARTRRYSPYENLGGSMIDIAAHGLYPAAAVRGGFFRGRRAWNNSSRPPPNSQAAHTGRWSHFLGGGGWDSDPGEHTVWDDMNATVGGIATFAQVAAKLPEAKYDSSLSHPRKQDKGFRKDVVAPAKVIAIDQTFDGEEEDEYEDVPICAACETQLFIPEAEGSKEASRPCAIRCGHLICAACYVKGRSFSRKQSNRKRNATRAAKTATSSKGKKKDAAAATIQKEPTNGIDIETQGIVERLEPGEWIGCPVPTCDGAGTQWQRKLGHPEGLWEVYLSVE